MGKLNVVQYFEQWKLYEVASSFVMYLGCLKEGTYFEDKMDHDLEVTSDKVSLRGYQRLCNDGQLFTIVG